MCLGLLDNLVSVLNISGSYSRSLNARPVFFPWSCDNPGQGVVSIEGLAQVQASPHVASPRLSPSFSLLCFSHSCRSSCSPPPTQHQALTLRRKGPPGARQASGPRVSGLVSRYFCTCPQARLGPQVASGRYNLQLSLGISSSINFQSPPCSSHGLVVGMLGTS